MLSLVFVSSIILTGTSSGWSAQVVIPSSGTIVPLSELSIFHYPFQNRVLNLHLVSHQVVDQLYNDGFKAILTTAPSWNLSENDRIVYKDFIDYANTKSIKVYGVTLEDPTFASRGDYLNYTPSFFESVLKLSKSYGFNFVGYTVDIEPHTLTDWDIRQELYLGRLITLSSTLHAIS